MGADPFPRAADESLHLMANALDRIEDSLGAKVAGQAVPRPPIGWAVLELLGHRREVGFVSEEEIAGRKFIRLATPRYDDLGEELRDGTIVFFSTAAIYAITPTVEKKVRDEIRPWVDCGEPVAVQVEGSHEPQAQPCALRRGHDGDHDPDVLSDLPF